MKSKQGDLFGPPSAAATATAAEPRQTPHPASERDAVRAAPPRQERAATPERFSPPQSEPADGAGLTQARWRQPFSETAEHRPEAPQKRVLSVGELTNEIKAILETGYPRVFVRGEVTGFRGANASGHLYFALKDESASINAVLFKGNARNLKFALKDGQSVIIEGALNVYGPQGRYSIIASRIEPEGVGAMALAFEQLKQKLLSEGLFGDRRTRPRRELPVLPRRIGVVTSVTGAALRDFVKVLHRRHPRMSVLVADARVQGDGAAADVSRAIRWLSKQAIDVLVVTRGGGSVEDLWAFNEEPVARAIFASPVPVVSAIGHEVDVTIADLVADVRAPTPSAAAEMLVPVLADLELHLQAQLQRSRRAMGRQLQTCAHELRGLGGALDDPRRLLADKRLRLSELQNRLEQSQQLVVKERQVQLRLLAERVNRQHPGRQLRARRERMTLLRHQLSGQAHRLTGARRAPLAALVTRLQRTSPEPVLHQLAVRLAGTQERLEGVARQRVQQLHERLGQLTARLEALSPLKVLTRGYALVTNDVGGVVRSPQGLQPGAQLRLRFAEGETLVQVTGLAAPKH